MKPVERDALMVAVGVVGLVLLANYIKDNAQKMAAAVPKIIADAGAGFVIGTGDVLGIPRTDETECEAAIREGRKWDASFACPAGTFIRNVFN